TTAVVPKKKRAGKEKLEDVVKEKEKRKRIAVSESDRVTKKSRIQKTKEQKVVRKFVVHEEDDEETEEEPLTSKRKRSEPKAKEV
ncbi:hypothetical protein A2U01_0087090, partial [Trifolium medium]|nr:hypothetical protein [Trifolium medium]